MLVARIIVRVTAALTLADLCLTQQLDVQPKKPRKAGKYPLHVKDVEGDIFHSKDDTDDSRGTKRMKIHNLYKDQLEKKTPKIVGEWSDWGQWTPCTRSCGGGITQQTRHCVSNSISKISDSHYRFVKKQKDHHHRRRRRRRLRRHNYSKPNGCVGLYKRIRLCNIQECEAGSSGGADFRYEQCAAFNERSFKGRRYFWQPFLQAPDECALNCRAAGLDFYARLNKTVIDGTPCNHPLTSTGKPAPRGTRGVCIDGACKSVSSNGIIGAIDQDNLESCDTCKHGSCRSINGLYTRPDLTIPGYSLVAQIPQGACRVLVQQLKPTRNFIALRSTNGTFIINGDWKFSTRSGTFDEFTYVKQDGTALETITSPGPLGKSIEILLVSFQANPGIKYGYAVPLQDSPPPLVKNRLDNAQKDEGRPATHHRRTRLRRRFVWKITGVSACSKSCGGGIQTTVVTCVREHTQQPVLDKRCQNLDKPQTHPIRCNIQDCPAQWKGHWGRCNVSCGEGSEDFTFTCQQDLSTGRVVTLSDDHCLGSKPNKQSRFCNAGLCDESVRDNELPQTNLLVRKEWTVGPWSVCSVSCGSGRRTRPVICPSGECVAEDRPNPSELCDLGACTIGEPSPWLLTDWSACTEACGTGTQNRLAVCSSSNCAHDTKPELSRACSSEKQCSGQWFAGAWGGCSDSCSGIAVQKREIYCVVKIRGYPRITNNLTCSLGLKPNEEQQCHGRCPAQWFMGEWGVCECPQGLQRREVKCMDGRGSSSRDCLDVEMPLGKRQCGCQRNKNGGEEQQRDRYKPVQDEPSTHSCSDKIRNCYLAVQARLCQYPYYINHCCVSCKKAHDLE